jgi:hypothetical protein
MTSDTSPTNKIEIRADPKILDVLSWLDMKPIDSLCELIDNAIDELSEQYGDHGRLILVDLPRTSSFDEGNPVVRIRDNGRGMTLDQVQNSLRAGYSDKANNNSLGFFGVGFNIATSKLGQITTVTTAREEDDFATEIVVDLKDLRKNRNWEVEARRIPKADFLFHGTLIEVSKPWDKGHKNHGFMRKLVALGRPKTLQWLGRIYATILRDENAVRIKVDEHSVTPYFHCAWDSSRYVKHAKHGSIPAIIQFDNHVLHSTRRCAECEVEIPDMETSCQTDDCGSRSINTSEEKISGWVGIQRYLDASHFGIDLIRNGRAIRILEKEAFFTFTDPDTGEPIVDYPIDDREGRIVGEISMDHVSVDPVKQNFERTSPEWSRVVEFLRGKSSLQPTQAGANENSSPIFKLYQGYRKVRGAGKRTMYMGKWPTGSSTAVILSKGEIQPFFDAFNKREPGYFDDTEWWKLVEIAESKPVAELVKCPECGTETTEGTEECEACSYIFDGKECINSDCSQTIAKAAHTCATCGFNQLPEVRDPWDCMVCGTVNDEETPNCSNCSEPRDTPDPNSKDELLLRSDHCEDLSGNKLSITLPSGDESTQLDVQTYLVGGVITVFSPEGLKVEPPVIKFTESDSLWIFLCVDHPLFVTAKLSKALVVANEVASYFLAYHQSLFMKCPRLFNISGISNALLQKYWKDSVSEERDAVETKSGDLLAVIQDKLASSLGDDSKMVYEGLQQDHKRYLLSEFTSCGRDVSELGSTVADGSFARFLSMQALSDLMKEFPQVFFDKRVFSTTYSSSSDLSNEQLVELQSMLRTKYGIYLEVVSLFLQSAHIDEQEAEMASAAVDLLMRALAE